MRKIEFFVNLLIFSFFFKNWLKVKYWDFCEKKGVFFKNQFIFSEEIVKGSFFWKEVTFL